MANSEYSQHFQEVGSKIRKEMGGIWFSDGDQEKFFFVF